MKWKALGVLGIVVVVMYVAFFYTYSSEVSGNMISSSSLLLTERKASYPMECEVVGFNQSDISLGVAVDTDKLDFGMLIAGGSGSTRTINIGNNEPVPVKVTLSVEGNISPYVNFGGDGFILDKGETRTIVIRMSSDKPGNYTGTFYISARKVNYKWLEGITELL